MTVKTVSMVDAPQHVAPTAETTQTAATSRDALFLDDAWTPTSAERRLTAKDSTRFASIANAWHAALILTVIRARSAMRVDANFKGCATKMPIAQRLTAPVRTIAASRPHAQAMSSTCA